MTSLENILSTNVKYDDQALCDFVGKHPETCRAKACWGPREAESFPLFRICALNPSLKAVVLVYNAFPDAVSEKVGKSEQLPLHRACRYQASLEVVRFLICQHPESIKAADTRGELPMHAACRSKPGLGVMRCLVSEFPEAVKAENIAGTAPFQLAQTCGASEEVENFLLCVKNAIEDLGQFPASRKRLDIEVSKCDKVYKTSQIAKKPRIIAEGMAAKQSLASLLPLCMFLPPADELREKINAVAQRMEETNKDLAERLALSLEHDTLCRQLEKEDKAGANETDGSVSE